MQKFKFYKWFSGPIILLIFALCTTKLWTLSTLPLPTIDIYWFVGTIMFLILPWFLVFYLVVLCWTIITLNEEGISQSFLGILRKKISWDDLLEIRILSLLTGGSYLFFSTKSLEGMNYIQAQKQKGQIQVACSLKLVKAILQFTKKEIINLPKELSIKLAMECDDKKKNQDLTE